MTMHLARGLTTLNTKKRKPKKRKDPSFYEDAWRKHNKFLKSAKLDTMTLHRINFSQRDSKYSKCQFAQKFWYCDKERAYAIHRKT